MFTDADPSWSLGILIGVPLVILAGLVILGLIALSIAGSDYGFLAVVLLCGTVPVAAAAWGFYPYSGEYHQWREVAGTVERIDKRLISVDDSMEDKFVVRYDQSGAQFACDDTRCAQVDEGDELTLSCKRAWQFTGTDGYDCRFVSTQPA